jgi:hypothetical protein
MNAPIEGKEKTMRKVLLTLAFAASALTAATTASRADDCDYGYNTYNSGYAASYRVARTYTTTTYSDCRTVTFRVYDDYSGTYVYRSRTVCN